MKKNIKIVAIIPARSGSKSIKDKNIQKIKKKPLLAWSIDCCKNSKEIDYFFVLTDSRKYQKIAKKYGADTPFARPKSISRDSSTDYDFINYSLQCLNKINIFPELILNIRPTTPFRNSKIVDRAILKFKNYMHKYSSLRSVQEMSETAFKSVIIEGSGLLKPTIDSLNMEDLEKPRQNFKKTYLPNGYVDIYKVSEILKKKRLVGNKVMAFKTEQTIEIDSVFDLKLAKKFNNV